MRLWKRRPLQQVFGQQKKLKFQDDPKRAIARATADGRKLLVWAGKETPDLTTPDMPLIRIEDGFLRSRGLGADLIPPLSLVTDDLGIYYDPTRPSRLEHLIAQAATLPADQLHRAEALIARLAQARLSKYNLARPALPDLPQGQPHSGARPGRG